MKGILLIELSRTAPYQRRTRQVAVVIDSCSTEELNKVVRDLRLSDPFHRTYLSIEQVVTGLFDELLTVMLPSAGLVERAVRDYIQVESSKAAAEKFRGSKS